MTSQQHTIAHELRLRREQQRILAWFPQADDKPLQPPRRLNRPHKPNAVPDYAKRERIAEAIKADPSASAGTIAKRLGVSASTVHKIKHGAPVRPAPTGPPAPILASMRTGIAKPAGIFAASSAFTPPKKRKPSRQITIGMIEQEAK